jgi:hypothetical protein
MPTWLITALEVTKNLFKFGKQVRKETIQNEKTIADNRVDDAINRVRNKSTPDGK